MRAYLRCHRCDWVDELRAAGRRVGGGPRLFAVQAAGGAAIEVGDDEMASAARELAADDLTVLVLTAAAG